MRTAVAALCIAGLLGLAAPASALDVRCAPDTGIGGEWPMQGQNLRSDRSQPAEKVLDAEAAAPLQPSWTFDVNRWTHVKDNEVTGYPVVDNGCVYVGSSTG